MLGIAPTAVPMLSPVLLGVSIAFGAPCRARLALVGKDMSNIRELLFDEIIFFVVVLFKNFWLNPEIFRELN